MTYGYDKPLYFLPFDHRGSFETGCSVGRAGGRCERNRPPVSWVCGNF
jgi:hypothetical protein